ncbi:hypothetical protein CLIB1444_08S05644 [[Candida] jaroonii]|uniref:Uncharacterized protein n=1 Tax=[Candida] jaroonii TaxID=467808 RepID=A0ACA9YBZ4_9ASCO|nr:hypothetical protein CLIB1444_08S05644 [[Candida] jaroonii]
MVDLPIGNFATSNGIEIFRADTKNEIIQLTEHCKFDLAVAVSYGALIPSQFLSKLPFGGLNVHPSLLPRYSGASPIQYALMNDDSETGVTVQTLHPTKFDRGDILLQSHPIPILNNDDYQSLESKLAEKGGELLAQVIDSKLYIDKPNIQSTYSYSPTSKINGKDTIISWDLTSRKIRRLFDALGNLSTYIYCQPHKGKPGHYRSVKLHDIEESSEVIDGDVGRFQISKDNTIIIKTIDGSIKVTTLTFQTFNKETAEIFMKRLNKRTNKGEARFVNEK